MRPDRIVGQGIPMLDAAIKATGAAIYTQDLVLPDMLWGAILRSPFPHARIRSIDIAAALAIPGVCAIVTGNDTPKQYLNFGPAYSDRFPLARDVVRFAGEEVAVVAAETPEIARDALRAIIVDYAPLDAVFDCEDALQASAPHLHKRDHLAVNLAQQTQADWGGVAPSLARAKHVVCGTYTNPMIAPVCMETNGVVARFNAADRTLDVWAGTQAPFFARKELAHILDLPLTDVRIRSVFIGGGFGGKSQCPEPIALAALLSVRTKRPVKIVLSRREEFIAGKTDHAKSMTLTTGAADDGRLLARHASFVVDNGAFTHMGPAYVSAVRQRTANLYRVDAAGFDGRLVYTNKVPGGSYRGMGAPQIIWAIETQIDELAEKLGRDPLEYRMALCNRPGDTTPQGFQISTCGLAQCLEEVGQRIGWKEKKLNRKPWRGIGLGAMINPSVGVLYPEGNFANVGLELRADGTIRLATQAADCGTSQNTILAQFAAEELGISIERIDVLHMDTAEAPDDLGSAASRVTFVTGAAAIDAAKKLRSGIAGRLGALWDVAPGAIVFEDDMVGLAGDNERRIDWAGVASRVGTLAVEGRHEIDLPRSDPKTGYGHYAATYGFGAQAAEVEVDPETGHVRVLKIVVAQDMGRVINPLALDGQMYGGIVQGIGMALSEELVLQGGAPVNASLITYRVPRVVEAPEIETCYIETRDPAGPRGAKAGGEHSINPTVAAIANAIADATGIRFRELPITPQRVLAALRRREKRALDLQPWRRPYNLEVAAVRRLYPAVVFPALQKLGRKAGRPRPLVSTFRHERPGDIDQAIGVLAREGKAAKLIAGGTDLLPGIRQGVYGPAIVVDLSRLRYLKRIAIEDGRIEIGASATLSDIIDNETVQAALPGFAKGIALIATAQIRNVATLAGDLCQEKRCWFFRSALPCYKFSGPACPCYAVTGDSRHHSILGAGRCAAPCVADAAPMLVALGAVIRARGPSGSRSIAMESFYRWSGETVLSSDEIIESIAIDLRPDTTFHYEKYAQWRGDFPEASAAVRLDWRDDALTGARIAFGGVSPLPMRATYVETAVMTAGLDDAALRLASRKAVFGALPLKDNAGKADMLVAVTERALKHARDIRFNSRQKVMP